MFGQDKLNQIHVSQLRSAAILVSTLLLSACAQMQQPGYYNLPAASSATDALAQAEGAYATQAVRAPSQIQFGLNQSAPAQQQAGANQTTTAPAPVAATKVTETPAPETKAKETTKETSKNTGKIEQFVADYVSQLSTNSSLLEVVNDRDTVRDLLAQGANTLKVDPSDILNTLLQMAEGS